MSTIAKDRPRASAKARRTTAPQTSARGLARRIAAWVSDDATTRRFVAERTHDQRLTRSGC